MSNMPSFGELESMYSDILSGSSYDNFTGDLREELIVLWHIHGRRDPNAKKYEISDYTRGADYRRGSSW